MNRHAYLALIILAFFVSPSLVNGNCLKQTTFRPTGSDYHTVVDGDTMWQLAIEEVGDGFKWQELAKNNLQVCNPDLIYPGNILKAPEGWFAKSDIEVNASAGSTAQDKSVIKYDPPSSLPQSPLDPVDEQLIKIVSGDPGTCSEVLNVAKGMTSLADDNFGGKKAVRKKFVRHVNNVGKLERYFDCESQYTGKYVSIESNTKEKYDQKTENKAKLKQVKVITVLFTNGVDNLRYDAYRSALALKKAIKRQYPNEAPAIQFGYVYNMTSGLLEDIIEVFFQIKKTVGDNKEANTTETVLSERGWAELVDYTSAKAKSAMAFRTLQVFEEKVKAELFNTREQILAAYRETVRDNSCGAVVVAHSQGNLFANWAYDELDDGKEKSHVSVIAIASPASKTAGDGFGDAAGFVHYTNAPAIQVNNAETAQRSLLQGDMVIGLLKGLASATDSVDAPLERNVVHPVDDNDPLGHGFVEAYLGEGDPVRDRLLEKIMSEVSRLRENAAPDCEVYENVPMDPVTPPIKKAGFAVGLTGLAFAGLWFRRRRKN